MRVYLEVAQESVCGNSLMFCDFIEKALEGADPEWLVSRHRDGEAGRPISSQDDVTAGLTEFAKFPVADEVIGEVATEDVSGNSHATARTSSRRR
jgi:hypothetical protein